MAWMGAARMGGAGLNDSGEYHPRVDGEGGHSLSRPHSTARPQAGMA